MSVIASVAFRNFKALRNASLQLAPFNLVLGPNGSGKTSLIEALVQLRTLARFEAKGADVSVGRATRHGSEMEFRFFPPHEKIEVRLVCVSETVCDSLEIVPPDAADWPALRAEIARIRTYEFDHAAMAAPSVPPSDMDLASDGSNLAGFLAQMRDHAPAAFAAFSAEVFRLFPEFSRLEIVAGSDHQVTLALSFGEEGPTIDAGDLSQGMLYTFATLALAFSPSPPAVVCIEDIDRGIHPRMLREIRDSLYRLSYPGAFGMTRAPVQVIATTHSPYLLDLFREHPEEIVLTQKHGREAHFERLVDRTDLPSLLEEGTLGDLWFSGILGGVPEQE